MHPEHELARNFWAWVAKRAHGDNLHGGFPWSAVIWSELVDEHNIATDLEWAASDGSFGGAATDDPAVFEDRYHEDSGCPPRVFRLSKMPCTTTYWLISKMPRSTRTTGSWLRAVALVLADAVRDPSRLTVGVAKDNYSFDENEWTPHTMVVGDDWSILTRSTFRYARRLSRQAIKVAEEGDRIRQELR